MDYRFLFQRLIQIIFNPAKAWETIYSEERPLKDLKNSLLLPLLILIAITTFLGSLLFTNSQLPFIYSVFEGIKIFVLLLLVVYSAAVIHKEITYALDLGRSFAVSFKIILYSLTPLFICLLFSRLFESVLFINILALYGLYIFWTGSEWMLNPPEHKKMPMLIATVITIIGLYVAGSWILTQVTDRIFFAFFA